MKPSTAENNNHEKKPAPRWRRRKDTRPAEILAAALEIFGERGYDATRLEDVGRRAGCTKGTVFLYYESKSELFKAAVREAMSPMVRDTEQAVEEHRGSSRDLMTKVLRLRWEHMERTRLTGLVKLLLTETGKYPDLARFYNDEFFERTQALLRKVIQRGVDSGEFRKIDVDQAARVVVAPLLFAAVWRHTFEPVAASRIELDQYFTTSLEIMLTGLDPAHVGEPVRS
jgi:AcrR family transcriptional regulator